ncbi:MAG: EpsG family protein [Prevotella sp.]|nr:EpsG family protein [Prevotella sp.]
MSDIQIEIPLWIESIFFALYFIVFFLFVKGYNDRIIFRLKRRYTFSFLVFFMTIAVFYCLDGDYFRYKMHVERASDVYRPDTIEFVYQRLAYYIRGNYNLFRLIVWGGAICLMAISTRLMRINVLFMLMAIYIIYYEKVVYARATLAMSIYFCGICYLIYIIQKKKLRYIAFPIIIIFLSIFFHRSMVMLVLLTPSIFVPLEKKNTRFLLIILWGIIAIALTQMDVMSALMQNDEEYETKYEKYSNHIKGGRWAIDSLKSVVSSLFSYSLFYIPFFYITRAVSSHWRQIPISIRRLYRICFSVITVSTFFFFLYGRVTVYFYRTLFMTMIPISILLTYCVQSRLCSQKQIQLLLKIVFVFMFLQYMTSIYNSN